MQRASKLIKFKLPQREFSTINFRKDIWTSDNVVKSPCKDIVIPKITLDIYIWQNLEKWPTKTATVCGITNRQYKYEEIYKQARTFGANLRKKFKMVNGDAVAVMMKNSPEYPTVVLGILSGGGAVTTSNPAYTSYEVQRLLQLSKAKFVIADTESVPIVKEALKLCKIDIPIITVNINEDLPEGTVSFKELVEDNHVDLSILKEVQRSHEDVSIMPYSSGTTGLPKCVELTHFNIVANCEQQNAELRIHSDTTQTNQDAVLAILPLFHSYGLSFVMLHKLSAGVKLITLPKFQPDTFINALLKYNINLLMVVPPIILFLSSHPQVTPKHLEHVRLTFCGAAPLPPADMQNFLNKTKIGELVIKGPNIMKGYKDNPEANNEVFQEGGWFRTGDLGKIDEDGLITISDRLKELIKVNANQVPPAELEYVLKEHPDVFDAAVIGIPDPNTGEKPKAFIVLKEGSKTTDKQIIEFVSERVAKYKRIRNITFVDSIPKNPSGKILRKVLKEIHC